MICIICIYLPETNIFVRSRFPTVRHMEFPYVQENPPYYPENSYQLLYTSQYYLITLVLSHMQAKTQTSLKVPFSSLNFCLKIQEFGYLNNLKYLNEL